MSEWTAITRRSFLATTAAAGAAVALAGCEKLTRKAHDVSFTVDDNPIVAHPENAAPGFFGDDPKRFHPVLWDKAGAISQRGGLPTDATRFTRTKVCIVGGGLAGLSAAYLLREYKPLLLEGAVRLGGNAKAHTWKGVTYGMGS